MNRKHTQLYAEETNFKFKDTHKLKVKGWKNIFYENENPNRVGVNIVISDKTDFKIDCNKTKK